MTHVVVAPMLVSASTITMRGAHLNVTLVALVLSGSLCAARNMAAPGGSPAPPVLAAVPGAELPIEKTHEYRMAGAVRPLLFWIGRDDVGLARIVWRRRDDGARGYELLVGTDPARAPRGINRWGFIAEEARGTDGALLALLMGSHDTSYEREREAAAAGNGSDSSDDVRAIRSRSANHVVSWRLSRVRAPQRLTIKQVSNAIESVYAGDAGAATRERVVAPGVRPGFLVAVADLVDEAVAGRGRGAGGVRYVFGNHTYEVRLRKAASSDVVVDGRHVPAQRLSFETRSLESGNTTRFELTAGVSGDLVGVPLHIEWQPRWWLRVSLRLADSATSPE